MAATQRQLATEQRRTTALPNHYSIGKQREHPVLATREKFLIARQLILHHQRPTHRPLILWMTCIQTLIATAPSASDANSQLQASLGLRFRTRTKVDKSD
jgi:hypothetical protein